MDCRRWLRGGICGGRRFLRGGFFGRGFLFATLHLDNFWAQVALFGEMAAVNDFKGFFVFAICHAVSLGLPEWYSGSLTSAKHQRQAKRAMLRFWSKEISN